MKTLNKISVFVFALLLLAPLGFSLDYEQATKYPIEWIYAHVEPADRENLDHRFILVQSEPAAEGGVVFQSFLSTLWTFGENQVVLGYADELVRAVEDKNKRKYPNQILQDLVKQLGITALPGTYLPQTKVVTAVPVGDPWPELSERFGVPCHHITSDLGDVRAPSNWSDARGTFVLRKGRQWTAAFYYYVKVR